MADIDDYLSYWSTEASIADYAFDTVTQTDAEGTHCVPSKDAVTVTFTLRNPKNFHFRMPGDSDAPADIITFPQTQNTSDKRAAAPQSGNDYEFKKISNTKLTLTYNPAFLQKYEWGSEAITPAITLYTTDGRAFKQTVPFGLTVNTPPPAIDKCVIAQTKTASSSETSYYVLCLQLSDGDMKERCSNGLLHEDIVGIEIAGIPYSLSVDNVQKQLKAQNGSYFIDKGKVKKLAPPDAENIPSDWTLYFKTDVKVMPGSAKKDYTIRLKDAKGLYSKSVTARTQLNAPQQAQAAVITGTKIDSLSGDGTAQNQAIVVKAAALAPEAQIKLSVSDEDVTIHYTLTEAGHTPTPEQTGASPVTVDMPLNGAGEKVYKLTYHTDGVAFKPSDPQTVYYKVLKEHTVTFNSKGGGEVPAQMVLYGFKISPIPAAPTAPAGYTFRNWCKDDACTTAWDFDSGTVTSDITLYARWDPVGGVSYTVKHFQQNIDNDNEYTIVSGATQTLSGTTGTLTTATANGYAGFEPLPIKQKTITGDGNTVVEVKYKRKRITVTFKLAGGNISGSTADVTRNGKFGAAFTAPVPTRQGYTFNGWNPTLPASLVFPAANAEYTARWTPKTYIVTFKVDGGQGGKLIGLYDTQYDTASGTEHKQFTDVPYNSEVRFNAQPALGYEVDSWTGAVPDSGNNNNASLTVQNNVTVIVKFKAVGGQSPAITTWEALRKAVQEASDGAVIEIANDITYEWTIMESTIKVKENITVKSTEGNRYTLNAHGTGADGGTAGTKIKGIFEVDSGKTLTLESVILTKTEKYAVYVDDNSSLTMKNVTIKDCKTQYNAAGIYFNKGKDLILENCRIEKCKGKGSQSSGGIDIQAPKGTVSIKDTTIENCEAEANGGGINLYNGNNVQCKLENVTVNNCSALRGGGLHVKAGTLTISRGSFTKNSASGVIANGGGGAIYNGGSTITITECTIGDDDTSKGNYAVQGGGIFVNSEAKCILKAGTKISGNTAMQIGADVGNGGGIFVDKDSGDIKLGTLTINEASEKPVIISKNTADYGGGVYNRGTAAINHAEIKDNNVQYYGGGMVNAGTCTMDSVRIENNEASNQNSNVGNGGGIYSDKELTLKDTTVIGNTAKRDGGAIYIDDSVFNMSGSTVINVEPSGGATGPSKNDIYLTNTAFITLTAELTATEKVARITLNSTNGGYQNNREIVKGDSSFTIPSGYENKFTITDKIGSQPHWKLISQNHVLKLRLK